MILFSDINGCLHQHGCTWMRTKSKKAERSFIHIVVMFVNSTKDVKAKSNAEDRFEI